MWTALLGAVVLAVNVAGIWEITSTLSGLREQEARTLGLGTSARARAIESVLSSATADLAFLVSSADFTSRGEAAGRSWRDEAGAALLVFLRGHPEVKNLIVLDREARPAVEAGRPRDVPGYWIPGPSSPSLDVRSSPVRREFPITSREDASEPGPSSLQAVLDPSALLRVKAGEGFPVLDCSLLDATGLALAGSEPGGSSREGPAHEVEVTAAGWGASGPWGLRCRVAAASPAAEIEPLVARHRSMVLVNLAVMAVAIALGTFALHQFRRREELEDRAREEARVRELERQLFHAERLATVGRLAASMAHEINNPLEGMANYLRLAGDTLEGGEPGAALPHLRGVREGLERAAGIVRRVLDHANPAGAVTGRVDLQDVVSRAVEFVRSRPEFSGIRFVAEMPREPVWVTGSGVTLGQVFLNLVLNACEAQPQGGEVLVRCLRNGRWVDAEVADRGPGIPASLRVRIFEPFESTKDSAGLGLSICHSIIRQHEGELSVHDREGGGSLFRVRLRAGDAPEDESDSG